MEFIDVVILIIIGGFALAGFWFGLIHTVGSLLGTIVSIFIASRYYEPVANWLIHVTGWQPNVWKVVVFIIAFILLNRLVGLGFWFLEKIVNIVTYLPFVTSLNRILGMLFGAFEGLITVGMAIYFIERFPLSAPLMAALAKSDVAPFTVAIASILFPLLPEALRLLDSTVDYVEERVVQITS